MKEFVNVRRYLQILSIDSTNMVENSDASKVYYEG